MLVNDGTCMYYKLCCCSVCIGIPTEQSDNSKVMIECVGCTHTSPIPLCSLTTHLSHNTTNNNNNNNASDDNASNNNNNSIHRSVLHVQSVSCWAPASIGPYSQANTVCTHTHHTPHATHHTHKHSHSHTTRTCR